MYLLEVVFDPAKVAQGFPEVEVRHGDGWPDGDRGLIIASALGGIVHFDQKIGQEVVRLEIPRVRSLHAPEKSDRILLQESDLPRDEP